MPTLRGSKQYKKYTRKNKQASLPTLRTSKQYRKLQALQAKKTRLKYTTRRFVIHTPKGRRKPIIDVYRPETPLGWPSQWGNVKIFVHNKETTPTQFMPRILGYKPRGWNWLKSNYHIHILMGCKSNSLGTPEYYKSLIHRHYILTGKIAKGTGKNSLNKALSDTFDKKLEGWQKQEVELMKGFFSRKLKKIDENSVRFKILKLNCYRISSTEGKEPTIIQPLMKSNIRNDMSKKGYAEYKMRKDDFNPDQIYIGD